MMAPASTSSAELALQETLESKVWSAYDDTTAHVEHGTLTAQWCLLAEKR